MGIYDGYLGLYEDRMVQLDRYSVSDMINRGGTFLGSARFPGIPRREHPRRGYRKPEKSVVSTRWWLSAVTVPTWVQCV